MGRAIHSIVLMAALLLTVIVGGPATAHAADEWCDIDPAVVIETPSGATVVVFVTNGAQGLTNSAAPPLAAMSYSVSSAPGGKTNVALDVVVPKLPLSENFATRTVASAGPMGTGFIYGTASGTSGQKMRITFTLDVA